MAKAEQSVLIAYSCEVNYARAKLDICISNLDGSGRKRVTSSRMNEFDASWSPDGRRLAFRAAPAGMPGTSSLADIFIINADGSGRKNLTHNPRLGNWSPAWSPHGKQIAYAAAGPDVWIMRADGSRARRLTRGGGEYPAWSPDGRRIVFMSSRSGDYEIYVINVDGRQLQRLTRRPGEDGWPAWSHDGKHIAFTAAATHPLGFDIYTMGADGSDQVNVTQNKDDASSDYPDWSPDGTKIIFSQYHEKSGKGGVFLMNADGSWRRQLFEGGVTPVWRPTSK